MGPYFWNDETMNEADAVTALAALAQAQRLRIFRALVGEGPAGLTPGALATALDMPASTLSFHLKELVHAGLVTQERDGRNLICRPALERMTALLGYLTDHCCQGVACVPVAPRCTTC
jgi:ArsR family transcriptional regulator